MCAGKAERKDRCSNQGLCYVQCSKRGLVASGAKALPYRDYLVFGKWVMSLLQVMKILPRMLHYLDTWEHEREQPLQQSYTLV